MRAAVTVYSRSLSDVDRGSSIYGGHARLRVHVAGRSVCALTRPAGYAERLATMAALLLRPQKSCGPPERAGHTQSFRYRQGLCGGSGRTTTGGLRLRVHRVG